MGLVIGISVSGFLFCRFVSLGLVVIVEMLVKWVLGVRDVR